jgi:predicted transcriptional regulator
MPDDIVSTEHAAVLRDFRRRLGWSQSDLANEAGVSLSTIKRLEKRGVGHNLRRVRSTLEGALAGRAESAGPTPRDVVDSFVASSGEPPSIMVREFLALLETLTIEQQWAAVRTFAMTVTALARARGETHDAESTKD